METTLIKEKLHKYINESDDRLLKIMYAIAKEYNDDDNAFDIALLDARRTSRMAGDSKLHNWAEAKQMIIAKA